MPRLRSYALAPALLLTGACGPLAGASPEPMGEPVELGEACEQAPTPTGLGPGDVAPNIVGFDQYGEEIDVYADLCDRHVLIARAGFD